MKSGRESPELFAMRPSRPQPHAGSAGGWELHGYLIPRRPITFDPRQEPGALAAHAGTCAGARSNPRPYRDLRLSTTIDPFFSGSRHNTCFPGMPFDRHPSAAHAGVSGCVALLTDFLAGAVERLVGQTFVFGHYRGLLCRQDQMKRGAQRRATS